MPKVGNKKFPYTPRGEAAAQKYAKKAGRRMMMKSSRKK